MGLLRMVDHAARLGREWGFRSREGRTYPPCPAAVQWQYKLPRIPSYIIHIDKGAPQNNIIKGIILRRWIGGKLIVRHLSSIRSVSVLTVTAANRND